MPVKKQPAESRSGATSAPTVTTPPNAFIGKASAPTSADLAEALGQHLLPVWERLIEELASEQGWQIRNGVATPARPVGRCA